MTEPSTATATDVDPPSAGGTHQALLYSSPEEFLRSAVPFLIAGRMPDDRALAITSDANADALRAALGGQAGEVEFLPAAEWYQIPARTLGAYHRLAQTQARRGGRLRVLSELPWDWPAACTTEWQRHEALVNVALTHPPVRLLCPYDERRLDPSVLTAAACTHPTLLRAGRAVASEHYLDPVGYAAAHAPPLGPPAPAGALTLTFGASRVAAIRQAALHWGTAAGLDDEMARDWLVAVHEVTSNAVEHGGGGGTVRFWTTGVPPAGQLVCEVTSAREVSDVLAGYSPPGPTQERGRGLWLARQICDLVAIRSGPAGATVRLWFTPPGQSSSGCGPADPGIAWSG